MRGGWWAVCGLLVGCGSTGVATIEQPERDAGSAPPSLSPRDAGTDAGWDAEPIDNADASDASAADALGEEPDAGPLLGRQCDSASPCPAFAHEGYDSVLGECYGQSLSTMFQRCTFGCDRVVSGPNPVVIDQKKADLCAAIGGVCKPWKEGGRYICHSE